MRRRILTTILALGLSAGAPLGLIGCGDDDEAPPPPSVAAAEAESDDPVDRAVAIGKAIKAEPDRTEEILAERGMTIEELEELMYEIAADPELSERYQEEME